MTTTTTTTTTTKRLSATEKDALDFGHRAYRSDTPVKPAWEGSVYRSGVEIVAGRDYVTDGVSELLRRTESPALDIETTGVGPLERYQVKVVTAASSDFAVCLDPRDPLQRDQIRRLLDTAPATIWHNSSFDIPILVGNKIMELGHIERVWDTILMHRIAHPAKSARHDLSTVAREILGVETQNVSELFRAAGYRTKSAGFAYSDIDSAQYLASAALDSAVTHAISERVRQAAIQRLVYGNPFQQLNEAEAWDLIQGEMITQRVMLLASARGYIVDDEAYHQYMDGTEQRLRDAEKSLVAAGVRPGVGADVARLLESEGALPASWKRTKTGQLSATKEDWKNPVISSHPVVVAHSTYAEITKNRKDYLDKLQQYSKVTGRVHPQVATLAAVSGRMSAGSPPVQQFPKEARPLILADDEGGWSSIDYSAVEPLVAAYTSGQLDLVHEIVTGGDAYVPVAKLSGLIPQDMSVEEAKDTEGRKHAKVILLGLLYGSGSGALAASLGFTDITPREGFDGRTYYHSERAQALKQVVLDGIPHLAARMEWLKDTGNKTGMTVTTAGRIAIVDRDGPKWKGYQAQNYFHQGSAYDLLSGAIREIHRQGMASEVRFAIHDELVVSRAASDEVANILRTTAPSMERFLASTADARRSALGTDKFIFPVDIHHLPHHWAKV